MRGAAGKEAAACRAEQSANAEAHGQARADGEQIAPQRQTQMLPVERQSLPLLPTLLPCWNVPPDGYPSADMSPDTAAASGAAATVSAPQGHRHLPLHIPAHQLAHSGPTHPGLHLDGAMAEHAASPQRVSVSSPLRSDRQAASTTAPATSVDMYTTAVPAVIPAMHAGGGTYACAGNGFKWHIKPGTTKLLVEVDTSVLHHSGQIDAAFTHIAQAVKGLQSVLSASGREPLQSMPHTDCAVKWISHIPHCRATQAVVGVEVSCMLPSISAVSMLAWLSNRLAWNSHLEVCYQSTCVVAGSVWVTYDVRI